MRTLVESILVLAFSAALVVAGCGSRAGQVTLKTGQCVLDSGVLAIVLADLASSNYAQLVADLETKIGADVVTCALTAIATTPAAGSGSGSASTSQPAPEAVRARELLAKARR